MLFEPTWDIIVEPEEPVPVSSLEIVLGRGEENTLATECPELSQESIDYWNKQHVEQMLVRAPEMSAALDANDRDKVVRMSRHISGDNRKERLSKATLVGNKLYLAITGTKYSDITGTSTQAIVNSDFRKRLMQAGLDKHADENFFFANAMGVCAAVYGALPGEGFTPVGYRSEKVMIYPNTYHVIGGFPKDISRPIFHQRQELKQELGLREEEMGEAFFEGIIRQGASRIPEMIFTIPVYVSQKELHKRWKADKKGVLPGKYEHRRISYLSIENELPDFLRKHGPTMVPAGAAALTKLLKHYEVS